MLRKIILGSSGERSFSFQGAGSKDPSWGASQIIPSAIKYDNRAIVYSNKDVFFYDRNGPQLSDFIVSYVG